MNLESYAQYNTQEIHSGYLNRLHTSRDFEADLVNLMKERFEVNATILFISILPSAAKSIGYDNLQYAVDFKFPW